MGIIFTIVIGFFVGLLARFLKPGNDSMGMIFTTVIGIVGALVGAFLGRVFGIYAPDEPAGFLASIVGAVVVLFVVQALFGMRKKTV